MSGVPIHHGFDSSANDYRWADTSSGRPQTHVAFTLAQEARRERVVKAAWAIRETHGTMASDERMRDLIAALDALEGADTAGGS